MLETDLKISGREYRVDIVVLKELKNGQPTEDYWQLDFDYFLEMLEREHDEIKRKFIEKIQTQILKDAPQELVKILQSNNQKLQSIADQLLDSQFTESVSGN